MAPELLEVLTEQNSQVKYDFSVDIWAAGVVLYMMIFGKLPFSGKDEEELYNKTKNYAYEFKDGVGSDSCRALIQSMLHPEADHRPLPI